MGQSSLWSISWLSPQMFYPYVTISAAQARESDDLHHPMSPFSVFFFGRAKNHGICEATKDSSGASSKEKETKVAFVDCFRSALWCNWPSNAIPKDADPELRHSKCLL